MSGKIDREDIRRYSGEILRIMDEKTINSLRDLRNNVGEYSLKKFGRRIVIEPRPSKLDTWAHTISYVINGVGIPIEIRVNLELDYSLITLKTLEVLERYTSFNFVDRFSNVIQSKKIMPGTIEGIRLELKTLSD